MGEACNEISKMARVSHRKADVDHDASLARLHVALIFSDSNLKVLFGYVRPNGTVLSSHTSTSSCNIFVCVVCQSLSADSSENPGASMCFV